MGKLAWGQLNRAFRIHIGKEVKGMINIKRPTFFSSRAAGKLRRPVHCRGQTLVEYALILAFVSIVAVSVLINLGANTTKLYSTIDSQLDRAPGGVNYSGP